MQIKSVILDGVRNFQHLERSFEDEWSKRIPDALLLLGPNGSGKTTLLNAIADLWQLLADGLNENQSAKLPGPTLASAKLAAVEIVGFQDEPLWIIYVGSGGGLAWEPIATQHTDSYRIRIFRESNPLNGQEQGLSYAYAGPGATLTAPWDSAPSWKQEWSRRLEENLLGKRDDLPNMVYLESETRVLPTLTEKFSIQQESEEFRWLARYEPTTSRKGSLQNYLYNLKVVDDSGFQEIIDQANTFLSGKQLNGFDPRTRDLMVQIENGKQHH